MQAIDQWLKSHSDFLSAAPQAVLDELASLGSPLLDHSLWTWAGLAKRFGFEMAGQLDAILKQAPGMDWVRLALASRGLDFADSETQRGIDALAAGGAITNELASQLKAIGVQPRTVWQEFAGMDAPLPATEEIAEAQSRVSAMIATEQARAVAQAWTAALVNEVLRPLAEQGATIDEIKAAVQQY